MRTLKATWIDSDGNIVEAYWFHRTNMTIEQIQTFVMADMHRLYPNITDHINAGHVEVQ